VKSHFQTLLQQLLQQLRSYDPRLLAGIGAAIVLLPLLIWLIVRLRRPSAEEIERRRRERLATIGRITDGRLLDVRNLNGEEGAEALPEVLFYSYRLAGVTYDCAQDVSKLQEYVKGYQIDQSLQVRYDTRNPGNSIIVSESWSGLWQPKS
jgi:type II secretory pathway component PulM